MTILRRALPEEAPSRVQDAAGSGRPMGDRAREAWMVRRLLSVLCAALATACASPGDDAGLTDGGQADGGFTDSGLADSGRADSGAADGGPSDSGRADGGTPCAPSQWPPCVTTTPDALDFGLFETPGTRIWLDVSAAEREAMNFGVRPEGNPRGAEDVYTLPDDGVADPEVWAGDGSATFADRVVVGVPGAGGADFGKVEVRLVGTTTRRPLSPDALPSLRFDTDEFQPDLRIGGVEHFRLNNGVKGGLLREHLAARLHRVLGYPAQRTTFGFLGTTVHGPDLWIPMVVSEVYRGAFCKDSAALIGGTCADLWKFDGDLGYDGRSAPVPEADCVTGACDRAALDAFGDAIRAAPEGPGLRAALAPYLDWPMFHRFRCLGVAVGSVDDALRNMGNNTVVVRRVEDGRFVFLPYSIDWSAFGDTSLFGNIELDLKCQADPECEAEARETCLDVADELEALQPEALVDEAMATLRAHGMVRPGDEERAVELAAFYAGRAAAMRAAVESGGR
jgi:hypothetical protein